MAANLEILIPFVPFFFSSILYITVRTCTNIVFSFRYWNNKSEILKAIVLIHLPPPPIRSSTAHSHVRIFQKYAIYRNFIIGIHTYAHTLGYHPPPTLQSKSDAWRLLLRSYTDQMPTESPPPPILVMASSILHACIKLP